MELFDLGALLITSITTGIVCGMCNYKEGLMVWVARHQQASHIEV